jgi:hypothetical protein
LSVIKSAFVSAFAGLSGALKSKVAPADMGCHSIRLPKRKKKNKTK